MPQCDVVTAGVDDESLELAAAKDARRDGALRL
jgi:hypothetical protein